MARPDAAADASALRELVAPLATAAGLELVDLEVKGSGSRQLVRVKVDRKGGVDLAACQRLSQRLSGALDEADLVPGRYALEVTSPGIDHPLQGQRAFDRVEGRTVLVHRRQADGSLGQIRGVVVAAEANEVVLDVEGTSLRIPYADIAKATQTVPW